MLHRFAYGTLTVVLTAFLVSQAQPAESTYDRAGDASDWTYGSDEGGGGSAYLGVDIADVSAERLSELKLKEEHGAEITMVDQDAPAGKAGLHEHDVIVSLNGAPVESAAQLRRMIKETPSGRVVTLGISRDGQPQSIKVQLADRHKSMEWEPKVNIQMPEMPNMSEYPISVVVVRASARSGLMVENITQQLGEFFGVKDGKGVLVRSVEKGSRGEKAGFRAGDVVIKVNSQPVHDTSDFTHALRSSSGGSAAVTVMRDKREQNLTLTIPEKKDSGMVIEESFDDVDVTAEMEQAVNRTTSEMARLGPAIAEKVAQQTECWKDMEKEMEEGIEDRVEEMQDRQQELQEQQQELREEQEDLWEQQQELKREFSRGMAEI